MELLESPKSAYLLEASITILHQESMEWLEEIEFWEDEIIFFTALIVGNTKKFPSVLKTKEGKNIKNFLINLSIDALDDLKLEVHAHERYLSKMLDSKKQNEQLYRSKHKSIAKKVSDFESNFKQMKKTVFQLAKKTVPKLDIVNINQD